MRLFLFFKKSLERALAPWNALWALGTEPPALSGTRVSANGTPSGLLEQSLWLYLEGAQALLERPLGSWNRASGALGTVLPSKGSQRAFGTRFSANGTPSGLLELSEGHLERPKGYRASEPSSPYLPSFASKMTLGSSTSTVCHAPAGTTQPKWPRLGSSI